VSQELICPAMAILSLGVRRWHCQDSITQDMAHQATTKPHGGVSRYEDFSLCWLCPEEETICVGFGIQFWLELRTNSGLIHGLVYS
jgi:hypothetical protein